MTLRRTRIPCISIALLLAGCSKVVTWDEDVVLNTGETITVHGETVYERGGAPGNPLKIRWNAQSAAKRWFDWKGQTYLFQNHASPLLIAIAPDGRPVIVAVASIGGWDERNRFKCTTPYYVQFAPDASGSNWSWPAELPTWLYGMDANLLLEEPEPSSKQRRFSPAQVLEANASVGASPYLKRVEPQYSPDSCRTRRGAS